MIEINFNNSTHYDVENTYLDDFKKIANYTLKKKFNISKNVELSVNIVSKNTIREINKTYRHLDKVTDVISFEENESLKVIDGYITLGDLFICMAKAKTQAKQYGHSLKREMCFLFTHGLLHLLKMDHLNKEDEEKMIKMQEEIMNHFKIIR